MSTNASIAVKAECGSYRQIYLHWDGYPEGAGKTLVEHYNTQELADSLMDLGDISVLGQKSAAALQRVFNVAQRLSGFSDEDLEELAKNSSDAQSDGSTSD